MYNIVTLPELPGVGALLWQLCNAQDHDFVSDNTRCATRSRAIMQTENTRNASDYILCVG